MAFIWVHVKDKPNQTLYIQESDFDPKKHIRPSEEEKKKKEEESNKFWKEVKDGKRVLNLGVITSTKGRESDVMFKGKLDSGATEELLDVGLEAAKARALDRQKKRGAAYSRGRHGKIVPRS